jgi:hypothetical protein
MTTTAPIEPLRDAIVAAFPELAGSVFTLIPRGWDSLAVDVDGRLIFKFPRHEAAERRLRMEVGVLAAIRRASNAPVPDMTLVEAPRVFSRHAKLPGEPLLPEVWDRLAEAAKHRIADQYARLYADLHAMDAGVMRAAGAVAIGAWLTPQEMAANALPHLPPGLRDRAERALAAYAVLPPDPLGQVYGYFDGHSYNVAFDARAGELAGFFDFGDSGFGSLHQEFIYSNFVSFDLTARIVDRYQQRTGRRLDSGRIALLGAIHILSEFHDNPEAGIARFARWAAACGD